MDESNPPLKFPDAVKNPGFTPPTPHSKNQTKKRKKYAKYAEQRKEKRLREKERQKQKRQELIGKGLPVRRGPSRKELKKRQLKELNSNYHVAIDLDCDNMMSERDVAKCVKQCLRIYTINRRSEKPLQLHLTGLKTDGNIHSALRKNDGWENWLLKYHFDSTHLEVFDKDRLIYLTSESDTILENLDASNIYVIGGLVDHNHHKNFCHDRAIKAGLRTGRLPLGEYVDIKTRTVLSTFHAFEILLRVVEGKSWTEAILQTIPARKGAKPKLSADAKTRDQCQHLCESVEKKLHFVNLSENGAALKADKMHVTPLVNTKDESGEEVSFQESEGDIQVDHSSCSKDGILEEQRNFFQKENIRARESHELKMEILKLEKEKLALEIENLKKDIVYKNLLIENSKINT